MVSKAKRLIFVSALAISILGAGMYGARSVQAMDTTSQSTLIEKIAQKFNLKTEEVQAVFDQQRQERQASQEVKYEQRLTDDVSSGKITESQKQLLITKHKEIVSNRQAEMLKLKAMNSADRRAEILKERAEIENWAKANGVDVQYLKGGWRIGRIHMK